MKSMLDLDLEGRQIKLYPGDSVKKWGEIIHATTEGVIVRILKVNKGSWSESSYEVGTEHFIPWNNLSFRFENTPEQGV
tara:strand:+ start:3204 stop:3440 length:237 start_codon:yes stop_codon:yes gene_type:complete